jgi:hypothetical protein
MVARLSSTLVNNPVASLDGRTLAARRLKRSRQELLDHLGHEPSPLENSLIDRIGVLTSRVIELEARVLRGVDSPQDTRNLLILVANLHQLLTSLGWRSNPVLDHSNAHYAPMAQPFDVVA